MSDGMDKLGAKLRSGARYAQFVASTAYLLGVSPVYYGLWATWRLMSLPFPEWVYQHLDDALYSLYQRLILFFFVHCTGVKLYYYGDWDKVRKKKERVLFLSNHQSVVDWVISDAISVEQGSIGHLRYVMKDGLQLVPLYGHYFYQHGSIYVRRGNFKPDKMLKGLDYLQNHKIKSWVIIFPEGTRYYPDSTSLINKSEKMARENGLPILRHHLTPRSRGTWLTLAQLRDYFDAVYDVALVYGSAVAPGGGRLRAPGFTEFLMKKCPSVHMHLRRIPMEEVPRDEEEFKRWMHQLFVQKDAVVRDFYSENESVRAAAVQQGLERPLSLRHTGFSFLFFLVLSVPLALTSWGRWLYLQAFVYGTLGGYAWLAVKAVC